MQYKPATTLSNSQFLTLVDEANAYINKGVVDCSTNPNYPAASNGHMYRVSVAGKIGGASGLDVAAEDLLLCNVDDTAAGTQAAVGANWSIINKRIAAATTTVAGTIKKATATTINTGTADDEAVTPASLQTSNRNIRSLVWRAVAEATDTAANDATVLARTRVPVTGVITNVYAYNDTAGTTGTATYDIHLDGTTIMTTTKISIETGEASSRDATTQPVLTTTAVTAGQALTFFCDAVQSGTAAKGLVFQIDIRPT